MYNTDVTGFSVKQKSTWPSLLSTRSKRNSTTISLLISELKEGFQMFFFLKLKEKKNLIFSASFLMYSLDASPIHLL